MKLKSLSPRESEIADLVSQGYANGLIADHLGLKKSTVKRYLVNIYCKLGFPSEDRQWDLRVLLTRKVMSGS